jgi:hypothetical protein
VSVGREASSVRHVLGLHTSGAELPLFHELHVRHRKIDEWTLCVVDVPMWALGGVGSGALSKQSK